MQTLYAKYDNLNWKVFALISITLKIPLGISITLELTLGKSTFWNACHMCAHQFKTYLQMILFVSTQTQTKCSSVVVWNFSRNNFRYVLTVTAVIRKTFYHSTLNNLQANHPFWMDNRTRLLFWLQRISFFFSIRNDNSNLFISFALVWVFMEP